MEGTLAFDDCINLPVVACGRMCVLLHFLYDDKIESEKLFAASTDERFDSRVVDVPKIELIKNGCDASFGFGRIRIDCVKSI